MPLQIAFPALSVLDVFMVLRAFMAYRVVQSKPVGWQVKFTGHVGFNIISFVAGFFIVLAIVLGAPIWFVVLVAVVSIGGGILGVRRVVSSEKKQLMKAAPS
jgi:hypothetical protein